MARRGKRTWRWFRSRWRHIVTGLFLLSLFSLGFYLADLYAEISSLIQQRKAALTSAIYSAPLGFEAGDDLTRLHLSERLKHLGYTQASPVDHPGEYAQVLDTLEIYIRDFQIGVRDFPAHLARLKLQQGKIVALTDQNGAVLKRAVLEPQVIGRLMPDAPAERVEIPIEALPPRVINTLLATEDRFFFYHPGFDPVRIIEAAIADMRAHQLEQGASTLTQQLARTFIPRRRRSLIRKLHELAIALVLEMKLPKKEILQRYVNDIYMGEFHGAPIYGMPLACRYFFDKDLRDADFGEIATLVGLIRAPSLYDPRRHPDECRARRDLVLAIMREAGVIPDDAVLDAAKTAPIRLAEDFLPRPAPYFSDYVTSQVLKIAGFNGHLEGLRVYTTLDPEFQAAAENAVVGNLERLEREHRGLRRGGDEDPLESSLVAVDPDNGAIRAMVGGRDYSSSQFNRAVMAERQTGSAFKPIVYLTALDPDRSPLDPPLTLASMLPDHPMSFSGWTPVDYEGTYHGHAIAADALAESLNIPTAYVGSIIGPGSFIETAHQLGIAENLPAYLPIAIGAGDTTLLELTSAYQVFASGGIAHPSYAIESVVDGHGHLIFQHSLQGKRLVRADVAYLITGALQGVIKRGTGAAAAKLGLNFPAAGKTGTTDDYRDAYFIGYTPDLVCGVWVGFDDPESIGLPGAQAALPAWVDFMVNSAPAEPNDFEVPPGITMAMIDRDSGLLATPECPRAVSLPFLVGTEPTRSCSPYAGTAVPAEEPEIAEPGVGPPPERVGAPMPPPRSRGVFDSLGNFLGGFFR